MRFVLERVTDPEIEPVSVYDFVRNVGEFQSAATTRQTDIELAIQSAREWTEKETGRALIDQKWRLTLTSGINGYDYVRGPVNGAYLVGSCVIGCDILLRRSPVIEITSFVSVDAAGEETEIDSDTYELREADSKWPRLVALNGSPWIGNYRIEFRAGYANRDVSPAEDGSNVPARFRQAILLHAEAIYDRDESRMNLLIETAGRLIEPENCNTGIA